MKDYKKILEGVVDIISTTEKSDIGFANICTYISENCPELAESEDERIGKEIIDFLGLIGKGDSDYAQPLIDKWISWLEKQGEQKLTNEEMKTVLQTEYEKGRADAIAEFEQAWSEEDEYHINTLLHRLDAKIAVSKRTENKLAEERYSTQYNWLKSLKVKLTEANKEQ